MKTTDTGTNNICQVKDGAETAGRVMIRSNALICGLFSASLAETKLMIMAMYRAQQIGCLTVSFKANELQEWITVIQPQRIARLPGA